MNTEGGRISQLVDSARRCAIQEQLAKARNYYGMDSCGTCKKISGGQTVPNEGSYLESRVNNCNFDYYRPPVVKESVRIARVEQEIFDKRNDPLNPLSRFVRYSPSTRSIIIPCPQVNLLNGPPEVTGCPLPNTILNSTIPR
jgi:hypothetical protein